jgi:hypothetical protein
MKSFHDVNEVRMSTEGCSKRSNRHIKTPITDSYLISIWNKFMSELDASVDVPRAVDMSVKAT